MRHDVKQKWIEALRSGKYEQGKEQLRVGNTYCCLGVLCDLYGREHNIGWKSDNTFQGDLMALPNEVMKWAGLKSEHCEVILPLTINVPSKLSKLYRAKSLTAMNDGGYTFEEIANTIATCGDDL